MSKNTVNSILLVSLTGWDKKNNRANDKDEKNAIAINHKIIAAADTYYESALLKDIALKLSETVNVDIVEKRIDRQHQYHFVDFERVVAEQERLSNDLIGANDAPYDKDDMNAAVAYHKVTTKLFDNGKHQEAYDHYLQDPNGGANPDIEKYTFEKFTDHMLHASAKKQLDENSWDYDDDQSDSEDGHENEASRRLM